MKNQSRKSQQQYRDSISFLLERDAFDRQRLQRYQRRSRVSLLWVLLTLLMTLVLVANLFTSGQSTGVDWSTSDVVRPFNRYERLSSFHQSEDRYRREILIWDYQDVQEYYHQIDQQQQQDVNNDGDFNHQNWSEQQIEEMERYYKRYLEVFYQTHGDQYEPEDKEVVYTEYLAYVRRKTKEKAESAKARKIELQITQLEGPAKQLDDKDDHKDSSLPTGATSATNRTAEPNVVTPSPVRDHSIANYDPFYLETDWDDFNKVGGDRLGQASNNTEKRTTKMATF